MSIVLYPLWINFVYKFQMGEEIRKEGPKTHFAKRGTPTMGGLIFVLTVSLVTFIFNRSRNQTLFPLFIASVAGLLGLIEDFTKVYIKSGLPGFFEYHFGSFFKNFFKVKRLKESMFLKIVSAPWKSFVEFSKIVGSNAGTGLETYQKFIIQGLMAGFVAYWTYIKLGWNYIWFPLTGNIHVGWFYPIFVFLIFLMILNFVAFTDGLDGLAGGLALILFIAFWILSRLFEYNSLAGFCATFVGALLPFLYFNVYPARVFMGNVGSHVLGATLAILAVVLHREIPFLIMSSVFLIDGASSPIQQLSVKITSKRVFRMAPLHHHFEMLGWPETKITLRFYLFGIFFAFVGLFLALL
jgi:phospho-N-acetylmuramoyl-pentapeptide-transferase